MAIVEQSLSCSALANYRGVVAFFAILAQGLIGLLLQWIRFLNDC